MASKGQGAATRRAGRASRRIRVTRRGVPGRGRGVRPGSIASDAVVLRLSRLPFASDAVVWPQGCGCLALSSCLGSWGRGVGAREPVCCSDCLLRCTRRRSGSSAAGRGGGRRPGVRCLSFVLSFVLVAFLSPRWIGSDAMTGLGSGSATGRPEGRGRVTRRASAAARMRSLGPNDDRVTRAAPRPHRPVGRSQRERTCGGLKGAQPRRRKKKDVRPRSGGC